LFTALIINSKERTVTKQTDIQTIRNDFLDLELITPGAGYTTCSASNASPTTLEANMDLFWIVFILAVSCGTVGYGFFIYELFVAIKNEIHK
tara:strand:+ start:1388 stop:1663 length:276 start_codon:yes stop_codon:yes gene_type:complete